MIGVYVKTNADNAVTDIGSSIFISDLSKWVKIDEGIGDRFAHAQGSYLPKPLLDRYGRFNYRLSEGVITEIPEEEKPPLPVPEPEPPTRAELAAAIAELAEVMTSG